MGFCCRQAPSAEQILEGVSASFGTAGQQAPGGAPGGAGGFAFGIMGAATPEQVAATFAQAVAAGSLSGDLAQAATQHFMNLTQARAQHPLP
jgi:hypothetical protein